MKQKFYGLLRVSTESQSETRLGLDSQKQSIENYVKSVDGELIGYTEEILSGGYKEKIIGNVSLETLLKPRPQLLAAVEICKQENAILIAKESSRISRSPLVIEFLINSGIVFKASDSPQDTPFILRIKSAIAAQELESISQRTTAALAQRKKQLQENGSFVSKAGNTIYSLGKNNLQKYNELPRDKKPNPIYVKLTGYVKSLRENKLSLEQIAQRLKSEGLKTAKNCDFDKTTVYRILKLSA